MTFKQAITLRNIMIILCIFMVVLLGRKAFRIDDKITMVQEAERLYAAGDLIAAENQFRQADSNSAILYKEELVDARLAELAPISAIRSGLRTLVLKVTDQLVTRDFSGFMESYASLLSLKAEYMKAGGPHEAYYRQLSADSGISEQMTAGFQQFKTQFLGEMTDSQNSGSTEDSSGSPDSFKWNLLLIPGAYYGGNEAKEKLLADAFRAHDIAGLKALTGAGNFTGLLGSALSMQEAYSSHSYEAPWIQKQAEESATLILTKDVDNDNMAAFTGHVTAYREYAASAGLTASQTLTVIDNTTAKLIRSGGKMVRSGQYAAAIQLYGELASIIDTTENIAAAQLAWNIAEPVRLLPGGKEPDSYAQVASVTGQYGVRVAAAGTDRSGRLHYADMTGEGVVSTLTGDIVPGYENLRSLDFDTRLSALAGVPVVVSEGSRDDGRTDFAAYTIRPEGITPLFSFAGDSYELVQEDLSVTVLNADIGDGVDGQTAIYRQVDGMYQFAEIHQEYRLISAGDLELYPYENISLNAEIFYDNYGRIVAVTGDRYIILQGNVGDTTGSAVISGQFQSNYDVMETNLGTEYVPVLMVDSAASLSLTAP
ncbi:hypothetical protein C2I18_16535 [Paenibacillus sp. PK3_47]|uniref:hypothetical protein n=1 Tax=Paenibacillus sp. PK3_47 TaxID=2072642 RepID=UPI00201DC2D0|nr:hypothetical protein [Paenibacillus sp. PK3_47]UQZ34987.1 hypothetical protein C2I18_16535 [Paenibacillus sp. PK3_47]